MVDLKQLVSFKCLKHTKGFQMFRWGLVKIFAQDRGALRVNQGAYFAYVTAVYERSNKEIE